MRSSRMAGKWERFNPRPCVRGDPLRFIADSSLWVFQSTPLCEGRRSCGARPRRAGAVSIHAPV